MKDVSKRLNENEAEIQETTINNSTLKLNQTGVNSSEQNSNGAELEENRLFPTWTPLSTTEYPTTLTLFNRRPRPKPILEISNENLSEDLTTQTTQLLTQIVSLVTQTKGESILVPEDDDEELLALQVFLKYSTDEEHLPGKPVPEEPEPEEPVHQPLPEQCCESKEEQQLDQSSSHFIIIYDLKTFVMHFILIILCFQ